MAVIDKSYHELLKLILVKDIGMKTLIEKSINRIQIPSYTFKHDFKDGFPAITTKKTLLERSSRRTTMKELNKFVKD